MPPRRWTQLALISLLSASLTVNAYNFPYPINRLGWVDERGCLSIWVNDNWKVPVSEGESLPIRFQFSSKQERVVDGCLGAGWWFPLLESTVVEASENYVLMTTLGGQTNFLTRDPKNPANYHSADLQWKGTLKAGDIFQVSGPDGWGFEYDKGVIQKAVSPSGVELLWRRSEGRVQEIREGSRALVDADYDSNNQLAKLQVLDGPQFTFESGKHPILFQVGDQFAVSKLAPSTSAIHSNDFHLRSDLRFDPKGVYQMEMSQEKKDVPVAKPFFTWSPGQGLLQHDGSHDYDISREEGSRLPKLTRVRTDHGSVESYFYDTRTGTETRQLADGALRKRQFLLSPGQPAYGKLRKIETIEDGKVDHSRTVSYDEQGRKIREIIDGAVVAYQYPSADPSLRFTNLAAAVREALASKCAVIGLSSGRPDKDSKLFEVRENVGIFIYPAFFGDDAPRTGMMHFPLASFAPQSTPSTNLRPESQGLTLGGRTYRVIDGKLTIQAP